MSRFVIDASVAIKWVVSEPDSAEAILIQEKLPLAAPDLIIAECANILWKKVRRGELESGEAVTAARILRQSDVEILPTRHLMQSIIRLAIDLDHAAYDCVYIALAEENNWPMVTADARLRRKFIQLDGSRFSSFVLSMEQAVEAK